MNKDLTVRCRTHGS